MPPTEKNAENRSAAEGTELEAGASSATPVQPPEVKPPAILDERGKAAPNHVAFGRLPSIDIRDVAFSAARLLRDNNRMDDQPLRRRRIWGLTSRALPLDQGRSPSCVGYSWATLLVAGPVRNVTAAGVAQQLGDKLYRRAQDLDEWPGNSYDGTSVRAGAKAATELGFITGYHWSFDIWTTLVWVINNGPCIFGTVFPDSLCFPQYNNGTARAKGVTSSAIPWIPLEISGPSLGAHASGHAYCIVGADMDLRSPFADPADSAGALLITNTWGQWGRDGRAWLSLKDAEALLLAGGECCMPTEIVKQS